MGKLISDSVEVLTDQGTPTEWKEWLNEIQATLISIGHCNGLTDQGASEFANRFISLQRFFSKIDKVDN